MAVTNDQRSTSLFYCCKDDLKTNLMRDLQGDVATMCETDLLASHYKKAQKQRFFRVFRYLDN